MRVDLRAGHEPAQVDADRLTFVWRSCSAAWLSGGGTLLVRKRHREHVAFPALDRRQHVLLQSLMWQPPQPVAEGQPPTAMNASSQP